MRLGRLGKQRLRRLKQTVTPMSSPYRRRRVVKAMEARALICVHACRGICCAQCASCAINLQDEAVPRQGVYRVARAGMFVGYGIGAAWGQIPRAGGLSLSIAWVKKKTAHINKVLIYCFRRD